jgi:hypothetical protein
LSEHGDAVSRAEALACARDAVLISDAVGHTIRKRKSCRQWCW